MLTDPDIRELPGRPGLALSSSKGPVLSSSKGPALSSSNGWADALLPELLAEQQELTAVERFARAHAALEQAQSTGRYRSLLPATPPAPGQQYAFEVNLDLCSGCKACVTACHALNGLDEGETWRSVGVLIADSSSASSLSRQTHGGCGADEGQQSQELLNPESWQRHVTTACHHCVDPGCLNGCPVLAYDKDPVTGIVRHLDDQCIGCQYCVMKCPYEVPRYSSRLGIVRKCDLCYQRLARDEAPACAQACPNEAIRITLVEQQEVAAAFRNDTPPTRGDQTDGETVAVRPENPVGTGAINGFLPDSPDPALTLPSTQFLTETQWPRRVRAADDEALRLEPPHWPLVFMLVLTQAATGTFAACAFLRQFGLNAAQQPLEAAGFGLLLTGLVASACHLGRPWKAWRSFLGWRRSWLSREIVLFQAFAVAGGLLLLNSWTGFGRGLGPLLLPAVVVLSALSVGASAMVYVDTGRPFWSARRSFGNFIGTTLLLGATVTAFVEYAALAETTGAERALVLQGAVLTALLVRTILLLWRQGELAWARRNPASAIHRNAQALVTHKPGAMAASRCLYLLATLSGILALLPATSAPLWLPLSAAATFVSEILARYLFFVGSAARRMPGGIVA